MPGGVMTHGGAAAVPTQRAAALNEPLASLTSMRFLAAVPVVLLHTSVLLVWLPSSGFYSRLVFAGPVGVSFFFVLSGFVLTWSARQDDTRRAFYRRRAARILPLHVLTWSLTALLFLWIDVDIKGGPALASLFLVQTWVPSPDYFGAMDTPSWSLGCELFFYALFPFLLPRVTALGSRALAWVAAATVAVPALAVLLTPTVSRHLTEGAQTWLVLKAPPVRLAEFVLGMLLALAVRRGTLPRVPVPAAAAACLAAFAVVDLVHSTRYLVLVPELPMAALIVALAGRELRGGVRPMRRPWPVRLGQWSFALYLAHAPFLVMLAYLHQARVGGAVTGYLAIAGAVVAAVALSGLLFTRVERPLERRLRPQHTLAATLRPVVGAEAARL